MQKQFNDQVILSKGGVLVPAIVIKSQLQADGREVLSLLYADPATGPGLVLAGATRKVGSIELAVLPLAKGSAYGWLNPVVPPAELQAHSAAVIAGEKPPAVNVADEALPGIHGLPQQKDENDADKASRLANMAHQDPVAYEKATGISLMPPLADGSGTGRYGDGADHWTQTSDGTDYPGSYGVGPLGSDGQPLKPFVPFKEGEEPVQPTAPEKLDEAQGAVEPDDPNSPHAL